MTLARHMPHAQSSEKSASRQEQTAQKFLKCNKEGMLSLKCSLGLSDSGIPGPRVPLLSFTTSVSGRDVRAAHNTHINLPVQLHQSVSSACT